MNILNIHILTSFGSSILLEFWIIGLLVVIISNDYQSQEET